MTIRVLIVDDEPLARHRINRLLKSIKSVEVVAIAENGQQAVEIVLKEQPDLVFMDIHMPIMSGLVATQEILKLAERPPAIIFCTAYDRYAVNAFKLNAAAYLLKPVMLDDLVFAIEQAGSLSQYQVSVLLDQQESAHAISIQRAEYKEKVLISEFIYFRSEQKHVVAGRKKGHEIIIDYSLKQLEKMFPDTLIRIHRNSLINKEAISRLVSTRSGYNSLELSGCERSFIVSRRNLKLVKDCFD